MFKKTMLCRSLMLAFGGSLVLASSPTLAQEGQRVEVTGSSIKRIDAEAALPVTVITRQQIEASGATSAAELLERISANNGQGYNQALAIGDSARPGFSGASLRGLGSNTTLILLNGRRLAVYAFDGGAVDLNSIALGAIERVEILRDGASAVYGTDAIAGVINFITRKDFRGGEVSVSMKKPQASGGGETKSAGVTVGFGDLAKDRFNVFGNLTWDKWDELKALDREFARTAFLPNAPGGRFDRTSGNTFPASIVVPGVGTVNPGVATGCLPPFSFQTTATGPCRFDYAAVIDILPPQEKKAGLLRGTFALTPNHELFAEFNRAETTSRFPISPSPISNATTYNGDPVLYPAGGKYYPKAINPATGKLENGVLWFDAAGKLTRFVPLSGNLSVAWRSVEGGPRTNESIASQDRFVLGAQGTIGAWDYNAAWLRSTSKGTEQYVNGWFSETKLLHSTCAAGSGPCGPTNPTYKVGTLDPNINPFALNDAAGLAALNAAKILEPTRISKSTRESVDGRISGDLFKLPAGTVSMAVGAEFRKESYSDNPLAVLSSGDVIGGGGDQQPVNGSRKVSALFGEFSVPVFKGFEALAQFRYDKYSDFGNTTNPKVGFRWQVSPTVVVRSSYGTGFRAPTLPDLLAPVTQTNSGGSWNDPYYESRVGDCFDAKGNPTVNFNPAYCQAQLTVKQGGNPNLGPEKSKQWNFGLVFQPVRDWALTVDLWQIKLRDQIAISDADSLLEAFITPYLANPNLSYDATTAKLSAAGKAAINAGAATIGIVKNTSTGNLAFVSAQFQNIASIDSKGVDLSLKGVLARTAVGQFGLGLETSYLISRNQDGEETIGKYLQFGPVSRVKNSASIDWSQGGWSADLAYRWQSGYEDAGTLRRVGDYEIFDLSVGYRGIKNLTLRAGIQNLFDRDPPYSRQNDYFHVGYDPTYTDPRGRTFSLAVKYSFQ